MYEQTFPKTKRLDDIWRSKNAINHLITKTAENQLDIDENSLLDEPAVHFQQMELFYIKKYISFLN